MNADRTLLDFIEHGFKPVHVERILKHVAIRFYENREAWELLDGLQQIERFQSLQPERHSAPRITTRKQQSPRGIHPESCAKQRRRADLFHDQLFSLGRRESEKSRNWYGSTHV